MNRHSWAARGAFSEALGHSRPAAHRRCGECTVSLRCAVVACFRTWMETERGSGEDLAPLFFHVVFLVWFPEGLQRRPRAVGLEVSPWWHTHLRGEQMAAGGEGSSPLPPPAPASPEPQGRRPAWRDRSPAQLGSSTHEPFAELKSAFCE